MNRRQDIKAVEKIPYNGHKNREEEYHTTAFPVLSKLEGQKNKKTILHLCSGGREKTFHFIHPLTRKIHCKQAEQAIQSFLSND